MSRPLRLVENSNAPNKGGRVRDGTTIRIEVSSRARNESLQRLLTDFETDVIQHDGSWQLVVQLGELGSLLVSLFETMGSWLDAERVESLLIHFDERHYTLLCPSRERLHDSTPFLLERVAQLEMALGSRIAIEQAKGVLARALGVSTDEAFNVLRKSARDSRTKLRDLAERIASSPADAEAILAGAIQKRS